MEPSGTPQKRPDTPLTSLLFHKMSLKHPLSSLKFLKISETPDAPQNHFLKSPRKSSKPLWKPLGLLKLLQTPRESAEN